MVGESPSKNVKKLKVAIVSTSTRDKPSTPVRFRDKAEAL